MFIPTPLRHCCKCCCDCKCHAPAPVIRQKTTFEQLKLWNSAVSPPIEPRKYV